MDLKAPSCGQCPTCTAHGRQTQDNELKFPQADDTSLSKTRINSHDWNAPKTTFYYDLDIRRNRLKHNSSVLLTYACRNPHDDVSLHDEYLMKRKFSVTRQPRSPVFPVASPAFSRRKWTLAGGISVNTFMSDQRLDEVPAFIFPVRGNQAIHSCLIRCIPI